MEGLREEFLALGIEVAVSSEGRKRTEEQMQRLERAKEFICRRAVLETLWHVSEEVGSVGWIQASGAQRRRVLGRL